MPSATRHPVKVRRRRPLRGYLILFASAATAIAIIGLLFVIARPKSGRSTAPTGTRQLAGVTVDRPSIDLGHVPLNVPVTQTFHLRNTGGTEIGLGEAHIAVLEGC
jgi:hypothetical protein